MVAQAAEAAAVDQVSVNQDKLDLLVAVAMVLVAAVVMAAGAAVQAVTAVDMVEEEDCLVIDLTSSQKFLKVM